MASTYFPSRPLSSDELGGAKVDSLAVVDPTTDRSAEEVNTAFQSVAQMSQTTCMAMCQFSASNVSPIVPFFHRGLYGSSLAVIPTITVPATGSVLVTFPAQFTDDMGRVVDVNMHMGAAQFEGLDASNRPRFVTVTPQSPNSFLLRFHDYTGTATFASGSVVNLRVW